MTAKEAQKMKRLEIENRELREKLTRSMDVYREHVWELVHLRTKLELVTMALNGEIEDAG